MADAGLIRGRRGMTVMGRRALAVGCCLAVANASCGSQGDALESRSSALGSADLVISQIYGGGGGAGSTYRNDFIELFNRGTSAISVAGWSLQVASATGSTWSKVALGGTVQPGHYYLIKLSGNTGGTTSLPTPDATGTFNVSATRGKVALVRNTTSLTCGSGCLPNGAIADFVGYGSSANSYEGNGAAPTLTITTSAARAGAGCTDTDNNAADFSAGSVNPRNAASTTTTCSGGSGGTNGSGGSSGTGGTTGICGSTAAAPAHYQHVVVFSFENRTWSNVGLGFSATTMPYLHGLASQCSYFTDWTETNTSQSSLTQYIGFTSGINNPATVNDCSPSTTCRSTDDNIFRQVRRAGGTARNYVEGAVTGCSASGNSAKHVPAMYYFGTYTDATGSHADSDFCNTEVRPYSEFDVNNL
ncbi:MAG TPA: lamin tail domain-containing protein, partial [Polyangia bacterium]|nr:lamin tail domain-containing protein [Polyangia bacterium]